MTPRTARKSRTIRVEDDLWDASLREAERRKEPLSEAVRGFLKRYSKGKS